MRKRRSNFPCSDIFIYDLNQLSLDMHPDMLRAIDQSWTLFLDRDGVINEEMPLSYVNSWEEFRMYEGVKEAFKIFAQKFHLILIITNQRGIGKGVTQLEAVTEIHKNLTQEIISADGRIDNIYFCADIDDTSPNRKPNPGMAFLAKKEFPSIDFKKSIMIGNTPGDMAFGRNAGIAINIFLPTTRPDVTLADDHVDMVFSDLYAAAQALG